MDINKIKENNFEVIGMIAYYLINHSDYITKEMIEEVVRVSEVDEEEAFFLLFCDACGLNIGENKDDLYLAMKYFKEGVKRLNKKDYINNPYYKNIKVKEKKIGNWEFKYEKYKPYEAFICDDLIIKDNFVEIPKVGYFSEGLEYLAVLENGNEWMLITPNEINTMQPVIDDIYGDVVAFGLGLGYFAYMASLKDKVNSVTVVERDKNVIQLFEKYILPQFSNKDKIKIINSDAFEFASKMTGYDYAFVDIWHDVSDGVELYLKMKNLEKKDIKYYYWIEKSILSHLRWKII